MDLQPDPTKEWFFARGGDRSGLHCLSVMEIYVQQGSLALETLVWTKGQEDWLPLKETELSVLFDAELPHLYRTIKNEFKSRKLFASLTKFKI